MAGIYISWPFCAQKCTFCNFASGVQPRDLEPKYLAALLTEIRSHSWQFEPNTVYLGGGTPGSMELEALQEVMGSLPGKPWREATMEAAPGLFTPDTASSWVEAGINRVSLGVQSFVRSELMRTGRRHDAETVIRDVATLRSRGIENINIDLISGLPGQTASGWRESLEAVAKLQVPHVSVYMLEVDDDSRLGSEILLGGKRYGAFDVPDDNRIADFYETAVAFLEGEGIPRYEISNFARPGFESLHNLKYWKREPYIGFGSDAHSFDGNLRWQNTEQAVDYAALLGNAREEATQAIPEEEKFFVGLRLDEGVETDRADWVRHGVAIERCLSTGMLQQDGERLRLTSRGVMVSNEVFEEFLIA